MTLPLMVICLQAEAGDPSKNPLLAKFADLK